MRCFIQNLSLNKNMFLKYGRLNTFGIAAFSETLGAAIIYQKFPCILRKC